jgi:hypothetical protein
VPLPQAAAVAEPAAATTTISVRGAREHNLKDLSVDIPRQRFTVITGVSGSGKSTLAFDIIFSEGQRRYLESLNAYARQFVQPAARADVDAVHGIPPTVAIEQRTSRGGLRSTVATLTEIYHFIRLLYVRLGIQHCPDCEVAIAPQSAAAIVAQLRQQHRRTECDCSRPWSRSARASTPSSHAGQRPAERVSCVSTGRSCQAIRSRASSALSITPSSCRSRHCDRVPSPRLSCAMRWRARSMPAAAFSTRSAPTAGRRSTPHDAPARAAAAASPSPTRACCPSTHRRAGAPSATGPG